MGAWITFDRAGGERALGRSHCYVLEGRRALLSVSTLNDCFKVNHRSGGLSELEPHVR